MLTGAMVHLRWTILGLQLGGINSPFARPLFFIPPAISEFGLPGVLPTYCSRAKNHISTDVFAAGRATIHLQVFR